jgi:diguanylate cyclase (GGDEF)-like protein
VGEWIWGINLMPVSQTQKIKKLEKEIKKLRELAYKDELTKLYNRHGFKEKRKKLSVKDFSLIIFDIDNFKKLNDKHGHPAGDEALKFLSNLILERVRDIDVVARWGGEEIVVCLTGANEDNAHKIADDIREKLEKSKFIYNKRRIGFTVSGGVAGFGKNKNFEQLFTAADQALYKAKKLGKNRIVKGGFA